MADKINIERKLNSFNEFARRVVSIIGFPSSLKACPEKTMLVIRDYTLTVMYAKTCKVIYITDNQELYKQFINEVVNQDIFGKNDQAILIKEIDWPKMNWFPKDTEGNIMKFDVCIGNPPYKSELHLKIMEETVKHADNVMFIHPAAWLQFPTRERNTVDKKGNPVSHFMNGLIAGFDMVERKYANKMFNIDGGDLVITVLKKDGMSFVGDAANDPQFCCFKFNFMFAANWKTVQSIYNKVIAKCPVGTFKSIMTNSATSAYALRMNYARTQLCNGWSKGGKSGSTMKPENCFRITSKLYTTACITTTATCVGFLNFATEQERYNAWQSYHTKFARFCIAMDESTKLAPYMGNYTQPWTDERFKEYFELTDEEWKVIDETIKSGRL